jgi:N-acetylneuraminic acid mutarotase
LIGAGFTEIAPYASDYWKATSTTNAPAGRRDFTAVWTGSKMIVWGGYDQFSITVFNTGGVYDPVADAWTPTSTTGAPSGRESATGVWTGSKMIVWGGLALTVVNTGGVYDPAADTWSGTSTTNAPSARFEHTAVWTGSKMIVWGGTGSLVPTNTGAVYDPAADTWSATSTASAPSARYWQTAVWTGTKMIAWGGADTSNVFGDGGVYDPVADSWLASGTSTSNAPSARELHTAVWTGSRMVVWGGFDISTGSFYTGGVYDPAADSWSATSTANAPSARAAHTAVWTGSKMIVWGGISGATDVNTGGVWTPLSLYVKN